MAFDIEAQLRRFLAEDVGRGDISGSLVAKGNVHARIVSRQDGMLAGAKFAKMLFGLGGCRATLLEKDGAMLSRNHAIMRITGDARAVLACERTALNLLARMSGIATQTSRMVGGLPDGTRLYATRKTAPGLRYFDKLAVEIGGGHRHRMRLDEMVMIKDNHIAAEGSLASVIRKARARHKKFEVEVESTADAVLAANEGAKMIMLDNFTPQEIRKTIRVLQKLGLRDSITLEASGGINQSNIARFGRTGVDVISVGSITSAVSGIDMSLEIASRGS